MCRVKFWRFFTVSLDCDAANTVETGRFFQEQREGFGLDNISSGLDSLVERGPYHTLSFDAPSLGTVNSTSDGSINQNQARDTIGFSSKFRSQVQNIQRY
jgi:hypothetical protein